MNLRIYYFHFLCFYRCSRYMYVVYIHWWIALFCIHIIFFSLSYFTEMDPLHITAVAAVEAKDLQHWTQAGNLRHLCPPNPARPLIRTWVRVPLTYYQSNPQVCTWITMTVVTLLAQSRQVQARQVRNFEFSRQFFMDKVFLWNYWQLKFLK